MAASPLPVTIIGRGRLGTALAGALSAAGTDVSGPLGRGATTGDAAIVLVCVPDREIALAARLVPAGALVGHCSASAPLDLLAPHERFVMHPLMTATAAGATFRGATVAIAGSSARATDVARTLGVTLGMRPIEIPADRRALYHAAGVMASNFLVALEGAAEHAGRLVGIDRAALVPLVRATLDNWAQFGAPAALTGPIARGDHDTHARLEAAIAEFAPDLMPLWTALARETQRLAAATGVGAPTSAPATGPTDGPTSRPTGRPTGRPMAIVRNVATLRDQVDRHRVRGARIGLVPTMGALHAGHLALMQRAKAECGACVATIFVNPTQFNDARDLAAYPRTEARDAELAESAGVDILFAPPVEAVYPPGFASTVEVQGITDTIEGAARGPTHFRGVATVVAKLLNMVRPDVAYFGQKDAQQALVIRRMAQDLDFGIRIEVCPTVRDPDGLAMSSRNVRLTPTARAQALAIVESLRAAEEAVARGERSPRAIEALVSARLTLRGILPSAVDYVAVVDAATLEPLGQLDRPALLAIAAHVGGVRLIDNVVLRP